jgi:hypothetical protein
MGNCVGRECDAVLHSCFAHHFRNVNGQIAESNLLFT